MEALLTQLGTVFTKVVGWAGEILALIMDEPLLLLMVAGFAVTGFVLGWVSRLFRTN